MQILREDSAIYNYAISVFFAGSAIFLFTRFKRHERMYNEANGIDLPRREPKEKDEWYFEKKE